MALTRPKFYQVDTTITAFSDPITVLHQGSTLANVDVGFLFNRANGLVSNVALYWSESSQTFVTAYTANDGNTNSNISVSSYANLTVGNLLMVQGSILGVAGNLNLNGINAAFIGNTGATHIGNQATFGNITTTNGLFWANGVSALSTYSNTQVAAYLPTVTSLVGLTSFGTTGVNTQAQGNLTVAGNLIVQGVTYTQNTDQFISNVVVTSGVEIAGAYLGTYADGLALDYVTGIGRLSVGTGDSISFYNNTDTTRQLLGNLLYTGSFNLPISGAAYQIGGTSVLNSTTLGSTVTTSSLTTVGTLSTLYVTGNVTAGNVISTHYGNLYGNVSATTVNSSTLGITQSGTGNQYALTMKGASVGDQWAFTVGSTAGQNNITSLNTAGSSYAPFTVTGSTFTIGTTGTGATTSIYVASSGNVVIPANTIANSTTTGALVVGGGVGVAGNLIIGGNIIRGVSAVTDIANTITSIGTSPTAIDSFANTSIRAAKYVLSIQDTITSQSQATEILLAQDGANVNMTTYGVVYTGTSSRMSFTSNINAGTVTLWATGVSTNSTVKLSRTAIPM